MNQPSSTFTRFPFLLFLLWSLWVTAEYWVLGDLSYLHMHDNADQLIPTYWWLTQSTDRLFGADILPMMGGLDRLSVAANFHLFHIPFLLFPAWLANAVIILSQRLILGYFTYRFLDDVLKVGKPIAILAGMAHTLVWVEHGEMRLMHGMNEAGFPLLLWVLCTVSFRQKTWMVWALGLGVFLGLSMDPIAATPFFLSTSLLCAWVVREDGRSRSTAFRLLAFAGIVLLCAIPFLWQNLAAVMANAQGSHRGDWGHHNRFLHEVALLYRFAPGMLLRWCGAILLALFWLLRRPWKSREGQVVLLLLAIAWIPGPILKALALQLREILGVLNGFDWTRFDRVMPMAMLAAACMGLHALQKPRWAMIVPVFLLGMCFHVSLDQKADHWEKMRLAGHNWRSVFGNHELNALAASLEAETIPPRVVVAGAHHDLHPMFLMPYGMETLDGYAVLYPERWQQLWGDVVAGVLEGDQELQGHFNWGSRMYLYHSRQPWMSVLKTLPFDEWYDLKLLSLAGVQVVVSRTPLESAALIQGEPAVTDQDRLEWVWRSPFGKVKGYLRKENPGAPYHHYRNPAALPRVFAVEASEVLPDWETFRSEMSLRSLDALSRTVLLVEGDQEAEAQAFGQLDVQVEAYTPEELHLKVATETGGALVHTSLWYPGWTCEVDGTRVPIGKAYGVFQFVHIPAGAEKVVFRYSPAYRWGSS